MPRLLFDVSPMVKPTRRSRSRKGVVGRAIGVPDPHPRPQRQATPSGLEGFKRTGVPDVTVQLPDAASEVSKLAWAEAASARLRGLGVCRVTSALPPQLAGTLHRHVFGLTGPPEAGIEKVGHKN